MAGIVHHCLTKMEDLLMAEKLIDQTCEGFVSLLASKAPVPGGGGAAALVGALGAALCSMAGNLTLGRKKYAAVEPDIRALLEKGEGVRTRLLDMVDADAAAFEPLSRAYSIPKDDPGREAVLEEATKKACAAPMEMLEQCARAVELLEEMLEKSSVMLVSDVGCGAVCCKAAMECASLNVYINTKMLKDRVVAEALERRTDELLKEYGARASKIAAAVTTQLRER